MNTFSKLFVALFLALFTIQSSNAQTEKEKFGKLDPKWVKMETYEADPDAAAVILHKTGDVSMNFSKDYPSLVYKYHVRIKILKESALDLADISIPYYSYNRTEYVSGVKGMTYSVGDGGKVEQQKLSKDNIYVQELTSSRSETKISFPNVKPGSVIEYTYNLISDRWTYIRNWYFQDYHPVVYSQYSTTMMDGVNFRELQLGEVFPIERASNSRNINTGGGGTTQGIYTKYIGKNISAFPIEPYTAYARDYMCRLEYQLAGFNIPGVVVEDYLQSWPKITKSYLENEDYGKLLTSTGPVRKLYTEIIASKPEDMDKLTFLYNYVRDNYEWNEYYSDWPGDKPANVIKEKSGNSAALNFLLLVLAKEAGYEVCPVLLSIRNSGRVQAIFPDSDQFNHSIASVKDPESGERILLDVVNKLLPAGVLPYQDLNGQGLLANGGEKWVDLTPKTADEKVINAMLSLDEKGIIKGTYRITHKGYNALDFREAHYKAEDKDSWLEKYLSNSFEDLDLEDYDMQHAEELEKGVICTMTFSSSDYVNASGDRIYVQPMLNNGWESNPFESEKRTYPVDFGHPLVRREMITFQIPEDFEVESLPEVVKVAIPDRSASFIFNTQAIGSAIQISSLLKIDGSFYMPKNYEHIRSLFDFVTKKHAEQIVLRRKVEETVGGE